MIQNFPPVVDPHYLRANNFDLAPMCDQGILDHWHAHGEREGRLGSKAAMRETFVQLAAGDILEIGPFCRPVLTGSKVSYLDILTIDEIRHIGHRDGHDMSRCPDRIHYQHFDQVQRQFDCIFSSHNIEHQPDLVAHLSDLGRVLAPGGAVMLLVPDKRYCFDHFMPESTIADALDARGRTRHSLKNVIENDAMTAHNDPIRHWAGQSGDYPVTAERLASALVRHEQAGDAYLDVHAWKFTPKGFERIIDYLYDLGLSPLRPARVYSTPYGRFEFAAVLAH